MTPRALPLVLLLATTAPGAALAADAPAAPPFPADKKDAVVGKVGVGTDSLGQFEEVPDYVTSDNLRLHTIQRKEYSDGGAHEFVLYPGIAQLNTKFTSHYGVGAQYLFHVHENFAIQAMGNYFYVNEQTGFTDELINKGKQAPQAATALTLQWAAAGGFEVTPIYGKFAFYEGTMGHFGLVLSGGAGLGGSRIQIQGETSDLGESTFGDTGLKFLGQVGAGFRVYLSENFLLRLDVKDLVYTAKVDAINGCDEKDLAELRDDREPLRASCKKDQFTSAADYPIALRLVEEPSSDVLNNVGVYGGLAYRF